MSSPDASLREFSYEGVDAEGQAVRGRLRAPTVDAARQALREQEVLVGAVRALRVSRLQRDIRVRPHRVAVADVAWFARSLASAVDAGLPVAEALEVLAGQRRGSVLGTTIEAIGRAVSDGAGLARAFAVHEPVLGRVLVALVEAGSESAALGPSLGKAATILETQVGIRRKVLAALVYPCAVLSMALLILTAMVLFVVPTFVPIFAELDSKLPLPTRILLGVSAQARSLNGLVAVVLVVIGAAAARRVVRSHPTWRNRRDRLLFGLPLFGPLFEGSATARLCWTLAGLLESGVAIQRAVLLAGEASGAALYREAMSSVARDVTEGRTLTSSMTATGVFPAMLVRLVHVGERTARTDAMLARYAADREQEVAAKVEGLTSLLEPVLVGILGALVGVIVVALYAPLFGVIDKIK